MGRILGIIATALFVVCLILVLVGGVDRKVIEALFFGGLACFAGAHVT